MTRIGPFDGFNDPLRIKGGDELSQVDLRKVRVRNLPVSFDKTESSRKSYVYSCLKGGSRSVRLAVSKLFQGKTKIYEDSMDPCETMTPVESNTSLATMKSSPSYDEIYKNITSCNKIITLEPEKTLSDLLEELKTEADSLGLKSSDLESLQFAVLGLEEEEKPPHLKAMIQLLEKIKDVEVLEKAESDIEKAESEELSQPFPFEIAYEALNNQILEVNNEPKEDLIEKLKNSASKLNNINLIQQKEVLLNECLSLKNEIAKELKKLTGKSNSLAKDKKTAFQEVYAKYLKWQKNLIENKSEKLNNVITSLQDASLSKTDKDLLKSVHKKVEDSFNKEWDNFCTFLQKLPARDKKAFIQKIERSPSDPHIKNVFKSIFLERQKKDVSIEEVISIVNLSKELGIQFIL